MAWIVQVDEQGRARRRWPLEAGRRLIGRAEDCAIRLSDPNVSRHHAAIEVFPDGRVAFLDRASINGSFVNDLPVRCLFLRDGDRIRAGATTLLFSESDDEAPGAETAEGGAIRAAFTGATASVRSAAEPAALLESDLKWICEGIPPATAILATPGGFGQVPDSWRTTLYAKLRCLEEAIRIGASGDRAAEFLEKIGENLLMACGAARAALWWIPEQGDWRSWRMGMEIAASTRENAASSQAETGGPGQSAAYPYGALEEALGRGGPSRMRMPGNSDAGTGGMEPGSQAGTASRFSTSAVSSAEATHSPERAVRALALPVWENPADPLVPPAFSAVPSAAPSSPAPIKSLSEISAENLGRDVHATGNHGQDAHAPLAGAHYRPIALLYFESAPGQSGGFNAADEEFLLTAGRIAGGLAVRSADRERLARARGATLRILDDQVAIASASPAFQRILEQVDRLAATETTVLILGESGTGKELIARALHGFSPRREKPLVCVNCSALPETLVESELFGHERGAFTGAVARKRGAFELADGGTLFLDEIGDMPLAAQAKLLRALETGEVQRVGGERPARVSVRVLAATNKDLATEAATGRFREDLYYRLNVVALRLPALRERPEDIDALADFFLRRLRAKIHSPLRRFDAVATQRMRAYAWPGNVRQLRNVIERALVFATSEIGGADLLPPELIFPGASAPALPAAPAPGAIAAAHPISDVGSRENAAAGARSESGASAFSSAIPTPPASALSSPSSPASVSAADSAASPEPLALAEIERRHIRSVLDLCQGNKQKAATLLGISRSTLYEKLREEP